MIKKSNIEVLWENQSKKNSISLENDIKEEGKIVQNIEDSINFENVKDDPSIIWKKKKIKII